MKRVACDKNWEFYESEESNSFVFGEMKGKLVDLPHDFIIGKPRTADAAGGPANGYFGNGQGIYKKNLDIPVEWEGKTVLMDVDGAYMNLEVILNGELLGMHPNGYVPYQVDLTPALRFDGRKNKVKLITQSRQPSTRWYSGGGLYRDVCLWVGGPVCVKPWDIFISTPVIEKNRAVVKVETDISGTGEEQNIKFTCILVDECGNLAGKVEKYLKICGKLKDVSEIRVDNPILWNIDNPYLYSYKIILEKDGEILDEAEDTFGIRKIEADAVHGFRLNGKSMKLKGGCVHHDNGLLGACAYPKGSVK